MLLPLLLAVATAAAPTPEARPLPPDTVVRDSLAGGETAVFEIEVPEDEAARLVVQQDGIDVEVILRPAGSRLPEHGLDTVAGPKGEEVRYLAVASARATWHVVLTAPWERAPRGEFTVTYSLAPADDRARAVAAAWELLQAASDSSWLGTGEAERKARDMFAAAAEQALAAGDKALAAEATYQCARRHDILGDLPGAIERQRAALALFREVGRRDREARALNRLGDVSRKVGEVGDSERYFREALPLARETGDLVSVADVLNNSGLLMSSMDRPEEALEQLKGALPLAQDLGAASVEVALWINIGSSYLSLGQPENALEAYEGAAKRVRHSDLPPRRVGRTLHLLARARFESGDQAQAEQAMMEAIPLLEKSGDANYLGEALAFQGRMRHAAGATEDAVALFTRALPLLQQAQRLSSQANILEAWADVDLDRGQPDAALAKLEQALVLARQTGERALEAEVLYGRARALQMMGRLDEAMESISTVVAIAESTRGSLSRVELRTSYLSVVQRYYDFGIDLLLQRGRTEEAFAMSERARARALLESLAESGAKIRKGVDPELLRRERALQAELNAKEVYRAQVALQAGEKSPRALALAATVNALMEEWNQVQARIRVSSPAYAALKMPEPIDARRVQDALLDAGTVLVAYHLGQARSHVWVVRPGSVTVRALPPRSEIEPLARRYHELLARERGPLTGPEQARLTRQVAASGRAVADAVWAPVAEEVQGKRVLIVADGALHYVPFAALPTASGEPLIVQHEIVLLPSASVLDVIRRDSRPLPARVTAAVFADPVFAANDSRVAGGERTAAPAAASTTRGGPYSRLRFSRKEAEAITAAAGERVFEALDFDAAKDTIESLDLRPYRIVHFATHGYLNSAHPELSGLVFSLVAKDGRPVDGFLHLHEIYNLDLDADLVVLSACRTALGKEVHGEGLIGLTRGFMFAGASRVVSSVWSVDDRASAQLMSRFYDEMLTRRRPPAAALRAAQLSLLRQPRWSDPHYWAAFALQGEWR